MDEALKIFHQNKSILIDLGIREHLNIPKFHSLLHYIESIHLLGMTDNYNTEAFERLHIDFAKNGWRASNHRDARPQMVHWLNRQEKMAVLSSVIQHHLRACSLEEVCKNGEPRANQEAKLCHKGRIKLPKHPSALQQAY